LVVESMTVGSGSTTSVGGPVGLDGLASASGWSWKPALWSQVTPAVPFSCGNNAASACGRASRAARRLASACRITGSLCTASSNTPIRSLACAAPQKASNRRVRVEARFMAFLYRLRT
jgi:hypothetical protein